MSKSILSAPPADYCPIQTSYWTSNTADPSYRESYTLTPRIRANSRSHSTLSYLTSKLWSSPPHESSEFPKADQQFHGLSLPKSMSDETQPSGKEYPSSQPSQTPAYLAYPDTEIVPQIRHNQGIAGTSTAFQAFSPDSPFQSSRREDLPSTYSPSHTNYEPRVTHWGPQEGREGEEVIIYVAPDIRTSQSWIFCVVFSTKICPCRRQQLDGPVNDFALIVEVPSLPASDLENAEVPLRIRTEDSAGNVIALTNFGYFKYTDIVYQPTLFSADQSRKRKAPLEETSTGGSRKRASTCRSRPWSGDTPAGITAGYPFLQSFSGHASPAEYTGLPDALPGSIASTRSHSPKSPAWAGMGRRPFSPSLSALAQGRTPGVASPTAMGAATFSRTSTLTGRAPPITSAGPAAATFNPYGIYPAHKATLKIDGDLNAMADDWTEQEEQAKRRLVVFSRLHTGSVINTNFRPVSTEERPQAAICISCITRDENGERYVTSVDTIYLLEQLLQVKFTTEEKNRIRRNLQGFDPLTVSKGKAETEDFFKLIMGFPNPKPRNIEKDVKVFKWRDLEEALKKIIGKYSASPSSTASTMPGPANLGTPGREPGESYQGSPLSTPVSAISATYSSDLNPPTLTPNVTHDPLMAAYTTAAAPAMLPATHQLSAYPPYAYAPPHPPYYGQTHLPSSYASLVAPQTHHQHTPQQPDLSHQQPPQHPLAGRLASWDYATFMEPPTSVPTTNGLYAAFDQLPPEEAEHDPDPHTQYHMTSHP